MGSHPSCHKQSAQSHRETETSPAPSHIPAKVPEAQSAAAAFAFSIVPRHVLGVAGFVPPSERLNFAGIGAGGMGGGDQDVMARSPARERERNERSDVPGASGAGEENAHATSDARGAADIPTTRRSAR